MYLCISTKSYKDKTFNAIAKIRNFFVFERKKKPKRNRRIDRSKHVNHLQRDQKKFWEEGIQIQTGPGMGGDQRKERLRQQRKLNGEVRHRIEKLMRKEDWLPEQIVGWCKANGYRMVSKSSNYEYIRRDKDCGGDLYKHCRFKLKHRKRAVEKYMPIKNRVGIEERPAEADGYRFGDWEMDLVVGASGKGAMVTLVERSTSYSLIRKLPLGKNAEGVAKTVVDMLLPFKRFGGVKTITTDNGSEFSAHEIITMKLGARVYFADPYCSWQKGHIENTNMIYRQYIPCDNNFSCHSDEELRQIQYKLNRRPREKIDFKLPYQEFFLYLQE